MPTGGDRERTERVGFLTTAEEKALLKQMAADMDMTMTDVIIEGLGIRTMLKEREASGLNTQDKQSPISAEKKRLVNRVSMKAIMAEYSDGYLMAWAQKGADMADVAGEILAERHAGEKGTRALREAQAKAGTVRRQFVVIPGGEAGAEALRDLPLSAEQQTAVTRRLAEVGPMS